MASESFPIRKVAYPLQMRREDAERDPMLAALGLLTGVKIITMPVPMKEVQARRHKRKSSRRWQKKWRKRFGTMRVEAISREDQFKVFVDERRGVVYAYPVAVRELLAQIDSAPPRAPEACFYPRQAEPGLDAQGRINHCSCGYPLAEREGQPKGEHHAFCIYK